MGIVTYVCIDSLINRYWLDFSSFIELPCLIFGA